jgi:2-oxoacid:acceptor oxidoreductase delta subunit (pyruvate/2-ketoisovalerate family)
MMKSNEPVMCKTFDEVVEQVRQKNYNYIWRPEYLDDLPEGPRACASKGVPYSLGADLMMREHDIKLDQKKCTECGICWIYCPLGVIYQNKDGTYDIDADYCRPCGVCVQECPTDAITLTKIVS